MNFNSALPLKLQPHYAEGTALASVRDDRNNSKLWKKDKRIASQQGDIASSLQRVIREVSKMKRIKYGGSPIPQVLQDFLIVSDGGDWYNCNAYDGATTIGGIVKVAKHQDIRCILPTASPAGGAWASKTIRGVTYTYTYNPVAGSTADGVNIVEYTRDVVGDDASSETDFITPCLNVGDIITAFQTSFSGPETLIDVTWQALADGRAWAAQPAA